MLKRFINLADRSAIVLSIVCFIHCLLLPIALIVLPTVTSLVLFDDERFHTWLLFAVIPISAFATMLGYVHHRSGPVVLIALLGMLTLVFVAILGHALLGERGEVVVSVIGSALVAFGHIKNLKYRKLPSWREQTATKMTN